MSDFVVKTLLPTHLHDPGACHPEYIRRGCTKDLNFRAITNGSLFKRSGRASRFPFRKALALFFFVHSLEVSAFAQSKEDKPQNETAVTRPCSSVAADSKNKRARSKSAANRAPGLSCLEAKGSLVDLHEFFQSYVRAQSWRIDDERVAADSWIFTRYLNKEELLQFAKEGANAGRVRWTEGKAIVQISARELDGGLTRVEVSARFQGGGQNVDRFAPPRDTWDLDSTGTLEKSLIDALEAHLKSLH